MRHCKTCTILERYDSLNSDGYCSWCVSRGHHRRPLPSYDVRSINKQPTLNQVSKFKALIKAGSVPRGARLAHSSTSAFISAINQLETTLGGQVYVRNHGNAYRVELTEIGRAFAEELQITLVD